MVEFRTIVKARLPRARLVSLDKKIRRRLAKQKFTEPMSLVITSDRHIQQLNKQWRKKNKPTDVLSFAYGEIFISYPTAVRQAKQHDLSLNDELCLLFVHGFLHILGFDHQTKKGRARMASEEEKILGYSGLIQHHTPS